MSAIQHWLNLGFIRQVEQLPELAAIAEAAGFAGVTVADRYAMPTEIETKYPYTPDGKMFWPADIPFPDPWVLFAAMAARTTHLRFASNIYLMALDDPFRAARSVATASILSGGRVVCGVAAGWLKEEFALAGVDFKSRGKRLDELLVVLEKLWSGEPVAHAGTFYDFPEIRLAPAPTAPVPFWVGGGSKAAMRRAAHRADGWLGLWYDAEKALEAAKTLSALRAEGPRADAPFDMLVGLMAKPTAEALAPLAEAGITGVIASPFGLDDPRFATLEAKRAAVEGYAERFISV